VSSDNLGDSRKAEKRVSCTQFTSTLTGGGGNVQTNALYEVTDSRLWSGRGAHGPAQV